MVKIKKIHKNISLSENTMQEALKQAQKLFGGNFSMYLTYLINKDIGIIKENNFITLSAVEAPKIIKEKISDNENTNLPISDIDEVLA